MTSLIFDFADIRSRMLGEDKPEPKPAPPLTITDPTHSHQLIYGGPIVIGSIKIWPTPSN
jgi:hypothetical protein